MIETLPSIDWDDCCLVERVPGRCGGRPTIVGTRIEPDMILSFGERGYSPEEIHKEYPTLSVETIAGLCEFAASHRSTP